MFRAKLSVVPGWLALCAAAWLVAGCSSTPADKTANWSPNRIYSEAKDEVDSGAYDKAVPLYEKLEGRAAGTPLAQQAQLDKAYAQYKAGDKPQAVATLDRFMKLHPASPAYDYALYLKGVINFNDDLGMLSFLTRQDLSERDQKAAKESFESFKELVNRFPESKYTPDARARMTYIVNSLAKYEVHVARYYYKRGAYIAAAQRARGAIEQYDGSPAVQEALDLLIQCYDHMQLEALATQSREVYATNYAHEGQTLAADAKKSWWRFW